MRTHQAQQLEVDTRRSGVEFRNRASDGPHLNIWGALWQLPSRAAAARPKFVKGVPTFEEQVDDFPAVDAMVAAIPVESGQVHSCPTCGHKAVEFDLLEQSDWFAKALAACVEALSAKYDLNDDQLGDLMVVDAESAQWIVQLNQWAIGGDTTIPPIPPTDWAAMLPDSLLSPEEPVPVSVPVSVPDDKPSFFKRILPWR